MDIQELTNYNLLKKLGIGGHVTLYSAEKKENPEQQFVATIFDETIAQNEQIAKKFEQNAKKVMKLEHKNIVKTMDYEVNSKYLALITEMLPGQNLQFIVLIRGISRAAILEIYTNIVKSIYYAHENGIIHYNLKPSNIIIPDDFSKLKIIDFGLTDVIFYSKEAFTQYNFESPMFCSPEFVSGQTCDIRSDIYSLGVLFYFMFSHKTPYLKTAPNNVIVEHIKNDPIPEIKGYGKINEIIAKATNKDPNLRYQNCQELLQDIKTL